VIYKAIVNKFSFLNFLKFVVYAKQNIICKQLFEQVHLLLY